MSDADDHSDNDDAEMTPEDLLNSAIAELLNIAASVAELQVTDESAEDIYAVCDIVADYFQIERSRAIIEEHDDGSFTTRFETYTGSSGATAGNDDLFKERGAAHPFTGSIRTSGRPKIRVVGIDPTAAPEDTDPEEEDGPDDE